MNIYMSIDDFNELFGNDAAYFNGYVSDEKLDLDARYFAGDTTPDDMRAVGDQFIGMMSKMIGMMVGLAVFIFLLFMYLLTKAVIDHSARSISYMKVFGYRDGEISHLYIRSITVRGGVARAEPAGHYRLAHGHLPLDAARLQRQYRDLRARLVHGCMRRHWLCDLPGRGAAAHALHQARQPLRGAEGPGIGGLMARSAEELKQLSIKEFTEAAKVYESGHAGIYEMCKDDYPQMLEELELEPFEDALDVGCGTGAVLELLHARYPSKHLTGLDLTPGMIDVARAKQLDNVSFVVGDAEALPFEPRSFDAVLCSNSFHHYPHPERFFAEVARVLRPGGRLVLRDYTSNDVAVWLMNNIELPLARLLGHGDVRILKLSELRALVEEFGLTPLKLEAQKGFRAHLVARKG